MLTNQEERTLKHLQEVHNCLSNLLVAITADTRGWKKEFERLEKESEVLIIELMRKDNKGDTI